ncbi:MAG TPA: hypothetical protein VG478_01035 [Acidimicrobiales bacterium]|nr:hypothetical protein [Acidimicrobiales bacterium]
MRGTARHDPLATHRGAFRPAVTIGLALLGVPRVVLHDLDIIDEASAINPLLVFAPPVVWIAATLACRLANPLRALVWVGATYGVLLAATHQLLWNRAYDEPPRLGGNLEGKLSATTEELVLRSFAVASGLATGLAVGAICGVVALAVRKLAH